MTGPYIARDATIIETLRRQPMTTKEAATELGYSHRGMQHRLRTLTKEGKIRRMACMRDMRKALYAAPPLGMVGGRGEVSEDSPRGCPR